MDWTDHVWTEVWVPSLRRFVHLDSCERAFDSPLLYEAGWGKRLTHVVSFGRYGAADSVARYSRRLEELLVRRAAEEDGVGELAAARLVAQIDQRALGQYLSLIRSSVPADPDLCDSVEAHWDALMSGEPAARFEALAAGHLSEETVMSRRRSDRRDLLARQFLGPGDEKLEERRGRVSGDLAWRAARGELGPQQGPT
jgi:hypothetical protein